MSPLASTGGMLEDCWAELVREETVYSSQWRESRVMARRVEGETGERA